MASKALVIKNVNFATNAVTTIEFSDIECTGITFSTDTITITGYDPVTVSYTVTPADTTDEVIWYSSNDDILTVEDAVLTVVGVGTCTITATCGNYSATATVSVSIQYIDNHSGPGIINHAEVQGVEVVTVGDNYSKWIAVLGKDEQEAVYTIAKTSGYVGPNHAIKLPKNTAKVKFSRDANKGSMFGGTGGRVVWTKDEWGGCPAYPNAIKYVSTEDVSLSTNAVVEKTVPEGADSFVFSLVLASAPADYDAAYQETGFTVDFLAAE